MLITTFFSQKYKKQKRFFPQASLFILCSLLLLRINLVNATDLNPDHDEVPLFDINSSSRAINIQDTPIRLAIIPGGGIRGYVSCLLLEATLEVLQAKSDVEQIQECFDTYGGTSTGSFVAAALSMGKTPREMANFYKTAGPKIFPNNQGWHKWFLNLLNLNSEKYSQVPLETEIKSFFGETTLFGSLPSCVVNTYDTYGGASQHPRPYVLHSQDPRYSGVPLYKPLLSSSAAPTYFDAVPWSGGEWHDDNMMVDGGVFSNLPIMQTVRAVLLQKAREFPNAPCPTVRNTSFQISVFGNGSQIPSVSKLTSEDMGLLEAIPLTNVFINGPAQCALDDAIGMWGSDHVKALDVELSTQIQLDDVSDEAFKIMDDAVERFKDDQSAQLDDLARMIAPK